MCNRCGAPSPVLISVVPDGAQEFCRDCIWLGYLPNEKAVEAALDRYFDPRTPDELAEAAMAENWGAYS